MLRYGGTWTQMAEVTRYFVSKLEVDNLITGLSKPQKPLSGTQTAGWQNKPEEGQHDQGSNTAGLTAGDEDQVCSHSPQRGSKQAEDQRSQQSCPVSILTRQVLLHWSHSSYEVWVMIWQENLRETREVRSCKTSEKRRTQRGLERHKERLWSVNQYRKNCHIDKCNTLWSISSTSD